MYRFGTMLVLVQCSRNRPLVLKTSICRLAVQNTVMTELDIWPNLSVCWRISESQVTACRDFVVCPLFELSRLLFSQEMLITSIPTVRNSLGTFWLVATGSWGGDPLDRSFSRSRPDHLLRACLGRCTLEWHLRRKNGDLHLFM